MRVAKKTTVSVAILYPVCVNDVTSMARRREGGRGGSKRAGEGESGREKAREKERGRERVGGR